MSHATDTPGAIAIDELVENRYDDICARLDATAATGNREDLDGWKWVAREHRLLYIRYAVDMLELCNPQPGMRLLDIGCGAGYLIRLARNHGMHAFGFDRMAHHEPWRTLHQVLAISPYVYRGTAEEFVEAAHFDCGFGRLNVVYATWTTFGRNWSYGKWAKFFLAMYKLVLPGGCAFFRINGDQAGTLAEEMMREQCTEIAEYTYRWAPGTTGKQGE